jgi:hypothetical protein
MEYNFTEMLDEVEQAFRAAIDEKHDVGLNTNELLVVFMALTSGFEACLEKFNEGDRSEELRSVGYTLIEALKSVGEVMLGVEVLSEKHEEIREALDLMTL